ncbi:MAG TPA: hypothetical protein VFI73_11490 [Candidatus Nitrosopolaris sp.]|nr:hypothetical protein [Candidatus Nitrosopolaris sp.]
MQCQKQELEREMQVINSRIIQLADVEKMHQQNFDTLADKICVLQNQKHQLEQFAFRFKNSNKKYLKVKGIAEEIVNRLLTDEESFLNLALNGVVEALRMNPNSYEVIFNNGRYENDGSVFDKSSSTTTTGAIPSAFTSFHSLSTETYQNYYYNRYHEGMLELSQLS